MIRRIWRSWPLGSTRASAARSRPVGPGQPRCLYLALQRGDLMTQDEDLGVHGTVGAGEQGEPAEYPEHRQVGES
jgi:hypothetical protein